MNVKLRVLSAGAIFFLGVTMFAQNNQPIKKDTTNSEKVIDEVVVLGYNKVTTKPKDVTANTTISSEVLENRPNVSFLNSLQGSAPGVTIASNSGSPGSAKIDIVIRGISSLNASTDPLVVIDGVPTNANQFRNLNPEDIETVSILRDAAATSIYGNRGANGVLIVKTKSGKFNTPLKFSYNNTTGISVLPKNRYHLANAKEFRQIETMLGLPAKNNQYYYSDEEIANGSSTDWGDIFFKPDLVQQHNLNATFGGDNTSVYSSLGYVKQGGMVPSTDFQRMTFRNNITGKSKNNKFTYNGQVGLAYSKRNQLLQETNSVVNNNSIQNPLQGSLLGMPTMKPRSFSDGYSLFNYLTNNGTASGADYTNGKDIHVLEDILNNKAMFHQIQEVSIFAGATVGYKLTDKWSINNRSGIDYKTVNGAYGYSPTGFLGLIQAYGTRTDFTPNPFGGTEQLYNNRELNFNSVTSTNYSLEFGDKHTLDLGAYLEYTKVHYLSTSQTANGLDPRVWSIGTGRGYVGQIIEPTKAANERSLVRYFRSASASKIDAGSLAYFATADYDYDGKYAVSGVIRRDGSYRFSKDNRWGTFWSVAARWNIDREEFMQNSGFQMLKLRASYGTQGNQNIQAPDYGANAMLVSPNLVRDVYIASTNPSYDNASSGYVLNSLGNPILQWEEIAQANIGLDFKILKGKLEGNVDVYNKQTSKLYDNIKVSGVNATYIIRGNLGGIRNRGIEVLLRYNAINKPDAKLSVFANGSYNKNTITDLQLPQVTGDIINVVGGPIYQWNVVPYLGINPDTGDQMFMDINGNVTKDPDISRDRRQTGKNYFPAYIGGFGFNASYKGFFLDTLFSFQTDFYRNDNQEYWAYLFDYARQGTNVSKHLLNAWTPDNRYTDIERIGSKDYTAGSDRFLRDASFIRFKSLVLGYTLPKKFSDKASVSSLKIFIQGENLHLWRKEYNGFDPEGLGTFPLGGYPNPRTISIGTSIEF